eukprot:TRINITY_DN6_c0_g1_i14.p1 TRINITY_DN6_c0_g1~~TRINITY_DN6_c0_g1_i14.p1  ORF type:complete len:377 (-),score=133.11 TRINITY_DN6_c0_g1_i14:274-1404(-)
MSQFQSKSGKGASDFKSVGKPAKAAAPAPSKGKDVKPAKDAKPAKAAAPAPSKGKDSKPAKSAGKDFKPAKAGKGKGKDVKPATPAPVKVVRASQFPAVLNAQEDDMQKMLACQTHIGTRNLEVSMEPYVWKRRSDGVHIINIGKTWEKIQLAARAIVAVENPSDIVVVSARPYGQRAVLKFATAIGAHAISGRFTPGTFTNQIQAKFMEPRLLIVTDPRLDHQPLREASYVNIPSVALCHTDSPLLHVDIAIPCNNKAKHSIGLMYWLLAREVLHLRGTLSRATPWDVMVDLYFYREESDRQAEDQAQSFGGQVESAQDAGEWGANNVPEGVAAGYTDNWGTPSTGEWAGETGEGAPTGWDQTPVQGGWDAEATA